MTSAPEARALVDFRQVSKRFGDLAALQPMDLQVRRGEVLGLLGPNGAGKTTALRILCGLLPPTEGSVQVDGVDVASDPLEAKRRLSFVPDGAPLYVNLSPRQHLELVASLHGIDRDTAASETTHLLHAFELSERADDPVGQFSRGMRQKTALACALLPRPPLLILDEPLNGLDAPTTVVFKEVLRVWAQRGGAVLYTSHLLDVAERLCDRIAILSKGELVAIGTLDELRERSGKGGTLEDVFGVLTRTEDPARRAREMLGEA